MISFEPLWNTIKERNISQDQLINEYHLGPELAEILERPEDVTLKTIHDICLSLGCGISDVMELI